MKKFCFLFAAALCFFSIGKAFGADVVPNEIMMPGTQPNEANIESPNRCLNCHSGYADPAIQEEQTTPGTGWMGSAMGNAGRDPIFWATLAIAEQDFDGSGDLCIRCHSSGGWIAGRSTPTDGSGLAAGDDNGIDCDTCHQMTNPDVTEHIGVMVDPFIANQGDSLDPLLALEPYYGSGMYVLSNDFGKLGPYAEGDAVARHRMSQSKFHRDQDFCGTCHDVSNSAVGDLAPNAGTQPGAPAVVNSGGNLGGPITEKAAFNNPPYAYGIVERTFSEYKSSPLSTTLVDDFITLPADLQDARGSLYNAYIAATNNNRGTANYADGAPRYFSCQTCHVKATGGYGCDKNNAPLRDDLPMHDMTGGNYWVYPLVQHQDQSGTLRLGDGLTAEQIAAMDAGSARAGQHLTQAGTLDVNGNTVRLTNMTGHKLISGYPEGRRMWLNVKWYDANNALVREDGAYGSLGVTFQYPDPVTGQTVTFSPQSILDLEGTNTKIYEVHPAITQDWATTLVAALPHTDTPVGFNRLTGAVEGTLGELASGALGPYQKSFHFVLNNYVADDNRIPPYLMSYDEAKKRNALPVPDSQYGNPGLGGSYEHWDDIALNPPTGAVYADLTLYYQGTSWEYTQFLWLANSTAAGEFLADEGVNFLDAWVKTGMVPPYAMATATWGAPPVCEPTPEGPFGDATCADGIDNDCDGLTDAEDPDCQEAVDCSTFTNRTDCNAQPTCSWSGKNKVCLPN